MEDRLAGLTGQQAAERLAREGPNEPPEERPHRLRQLAKKLWGPIPWMLELTIALELSIGHVVEAGVIGVLLLVNAAIGELQEHRARNALTVLRKRLQIRARTRRDGHWQLLPARELVVGDVVHLRMGDVAPADVRLAEGQVLLDESALTGESLPVESGPEGVAHAGTVVQRGEATGIVTATGLRTAFGRTVELVRLAKSKSHLESVVFAIVKYLIAFDVALVIAVLVYALATAQPMFEMLPFALILLVASVPVALPATFTVATAFGATELVREGVLVTRLAAIEEAAGMDVLCSDKTGTITANQLTVASVLPYPPYTREQVLALASMASEESTQDPIDLAILAEAHRSSAAIQVPATRRFVPFDSATKRSEAIVSEREHVTRTVKGAPASVMALVEGDAQRVAADLARLAAEGARVLAVATGDAGGPLALAGLVGLADPPRPDSSALIRRLHELGVRVVMVSGDTTPTALAVAREVGIGERVYPPGRLRERGDDVLMHDVFAGVLPEDKLHLVRAFQRQGHITGMTGDGVNDAPALKQAEVGIAVASATDVAKAAASIVLTRPGLGDVVAAVQTSRRIYQRMVTYTLNKIVKTCEIALLLSVGFMVTGTFVTTPTLIVLLLFTNDFVTMSIATDRTTVPAAPTRWHIRSLMRTALTLASLILLMSFGVFFVGRDILGLPLAQLQTLMFVVLVFGGQGTVYLVRERRHFWKSMPSRWLLASSIIDVCVVSLMAVLGILMAPIQPWLVLATLGIVAVFLVGVDAIKVRIMHPD